MPEENAVAAEPSISDLRALFNTPAPESETPSAAADAAPAPKAKAEEKPAPATEPETAEETTERDASGKFKAKEPDDSPGVAKRIGKALQAQREAEARAAAAEAKLAQSGSQPAKETAPPVDTAKPDAAKFETYEAYIEALTAWQLDVRDATKANAETARANAAAWKARETAAKGLYDDYDDVIAGAATMPISRTMHESIIESDIGPQLAYHLATHPEEAARIHALSPNAGAREMGKLEAKLLAAEPAAAASSKPDKPASAAKLPRPAASVGGSHAPSATDLNDPHLSMRDFKREVSKRLAN